MKADLIDRFIGFGMQHELFLPEDRVVVAISGGGDSLALVDLFSRVYQNIVLAHCNFRLRGEESDADEVFVRKISVVYDLPLYVTEFDTVDYAREKGISVEMAARELRYDWFEKIRTEVTADWIAVAHHADDSAETLLINLVRGTGLKGLSGIRPLQGKIIRPMLFTNRTEITDYLAFRNLEYRTDSSNNNTNFVRNRIRHIILPELEKINPSIRQTLREEQMMLHQAHKIVSAYSQQKADELTTFKEDQIRISLSGLQQEAFPETILYEMIGPLGFHGRQIPRILAAAATGTGKLFESRTHTLLIDRRHIIVAPATVNNSDRYYFDPEMPDQDLPLALQWQVIDGEGYQPVRDPFYACLDKEKLDFPLIMRKWEKGDYFYPLGMNQSKKVSDFFIDQKVNRLDKSHTWILCSGEQIVWIVGLRIDQRFRVTEETVEVLEIRIPPSPPPLLIKSGS